MPDNTGSSRGGSNKLLFWFVSRPRRMKINCCFVFSQNNDTDSIRQESQDSPPKPSPRKNKSTRTSSTSSSRRRVRIEDIGLPFDFRHTTHLGPDSDLTNPHQLSIVCSNL